MTDALTTNPTLRAWVQMVVEHAKPDRVHWCVGTKSERAERLQESLH